MVVEKQEVRRTSEKNNHLINHRKRAPSMTRRARWSASVGNSARPPPLFLSNHIKNKQNRRLRLSSSAASQVVASRWTEGSDRQSGRVEILPIDLPSLVSALPPLGATRLECMLSRRTVVCECFSLVRAADSASTSSHEPCIDHVRASPRSDGLPRASSSSRAT